MKHTTARNAPTMKTPGTLMLEALTGQVVVDGQGEELAVESATMTMDQRQYLLVITLYLGENCFGMPRFREVRLDAPVFKCSNVKRTAAGGVPL